MFAAEALDLPDAFAFGPDQHLYVSSRVGDTVERFHGETGAYLGTFASEGGLDHPEMLAFRGDHLYVVSGLTNEVLRYDATSGAFVDAFASGASLNAPFGLGPLVLVGGPETVRQKLAEYRKQVRFDNALLMIQCGTMPNAMARANIDAIAEEILPHFQDK